MTLRNLYIKVFGWHVCLINLSFITSSQRLLHSKFFMKILHSDTLIEYLQKLFCQGKDFLAVYH
jgi:hypothetical protein